MPHLEIGLRLSEGVIADERGACGFHAASVDGAPKARASLPRASPASELYGTPIKTGPRLDDQSFGSPDQSIKFLLSIRGETALRSLPAAVAAAVSPDRPLLETGAC